MTFLNFLQSIYVQKPLSPFVLCLSPPYHSPLLLCLLITTQSSLSLPLCDYLSLSPSLWLSFSLGDSHFVTLILSAGVFLTVCSSLCVSHSLPTYISFSLSLSFSFSLSLTISLPLSLSLINSPDRISCCQFNIQSLEVRRIWTKIN